MFFKHKHHQENLEHKEVLIERKKKELVKTMDSDLEKLNRINKILNNGITLKIYLSTGDKHAK